MAKKVYKVNLQQIPKVEDYMRCVKARKGHKIVQLDFNSIEDIVLAEASEDEALMKIYKAEHNCGYLFIGANLGVPSIRDPIRKYYDPDNPTKEGVEQAKEHAKPARKGCKTIKLAMGYGAWPKTIMKRLEAAGFPITHEQSQTVFTDYWETFAGVKRFEAALNVEWRNNRGWIFNGTGRPLAVDSEKLKDLVNRYCQSTAHDLLLKYLLIINRMRIERKIPMWPWIPDLHDETMWETPDAYAEDVKKILLDALAELNAEANGILPIKGGVCIADNLWDIKNS